MADTEMQNRILALSGVFQAAELVRQIATQGSWSGYAASTCINSLFTLESSSVDEVYGGADKLNLGVETLVSVLNGEHGHVDALRYSVGVLQLLKHFNRDQSMQEAIGSGLKEIAQMPEQEDLQENQVTAIANLYEQTISRLRNRIQVSGDPQHLKNPRNISWVRALLFAGLRSAVLWQQMGGGRLQLIFGRKRILEEAKQLIAL